MTPARPTQESMAALLALAEKATPGPWKTCATEAMPVAAQAALVAKNIENRAGDRVWGAYAPNHPEYEGGTALVWTALVGNGPDSEANAAYIAAASPEVVAGLVAEIERLREALRGAEKWAHVLDWGTPVADEKWGVGDPNKAAVWESQIMDDGTPFTVLYGEHPHSRNDNRMYARFQDGKIEDFDGHRVRTRVDLRTFNYLKCSGLSGNEVRRGGQLRIYLNDRLVWAKFVREADHGLLLAHQTLERLNDCPVMLWKPEEPEIGRRVFYREQPAVIEAFYCDENESSGNRLVLRHDGGKFSAPCWSDGDPEDASERVVTNTLDEAIWWWREDKARGEDDRG